MTKEKTASDILFPEKVIAGYKIKPWSWGDINNISPVLEKVVYKLMKKEITLGTLMEKLPKVLVLIMPEITEILVKSLNVNKEKIEALPAGIVLSIVLTMIQQNMVYLKNSLGLMIEAVKEMTKGIKA